ncbi:MAG: formylglycine-generating enzyme family protein, partial [Acidobacteriota bacterium]
DFIADITFTATSGRNYTRVKLQSSPPKPLSQRRGLMIGGGALAVIAALVVTLWNLNTSSDLRVEMVQLPGGTFTMGSNDGDDYEKPPHQVTVGAFAIGKYEVTQGQWQRVMGNNPSRHKGGDLPVENVSWEEAQAFCRKLGNGYRLPTEAEWEYAARAGSTTKWSFGNDESKLGEYVWFDGNSGNQTHLVGQKRENDFKLFDMHGNVWEWCEDDWHNNYKDEWHNNNKGAPPDGSAWNPADISARGSYRVTRGGGWSNGAVYCRSAFRHNAYQAGNRDINLGFRLARTLR